MICESNMEIIKTIGMIGAVTIFYFCPIPLVVAGVVWCVQICLRALKSNLAPKRNVFLLADIAMPFVITSAWIRNGINEEPIRPLEEFFAEKTGDL